MQDCDILSSISFLFRRLIEQEQNSQNKVKLRYSKMDARESGRVRMDPRGRLIRAVILILLGLFAGGDPEELWAQHGGGMTSSCATCHTMHNSQGNQPMRYDLVSTPSAKLIRAETVNGLCVYCHGEGASQSPDVTSPVSTLLDPAAGSFASSSGESSTGHDLGVSGAVPGGGMEDMTLSCISCHDSHGNGEYRNLEPEPGVEPEEQTVALLSEEAMGLGSMGSAPGSQGAGMGVSVTVDQVAGSGGSLEKYESSNVVYIQGMSQWCCQCHSDYCQADAGAMGRAFRHPANGSVTGEAASMFSNSTAQQTVRVEDPTGVGGSGAEARIFCLTCHKAHGSGNPYGLIYADGERLLSTCQQCHNQ